MHYISQYGGKEEYVFLTILFMSWNTGVFRVTRVIRVIQVIRVTRVTGKLFSDP